MLLAPSSFTFRRLSRPRNKKYELNHKLKIKSGKMAGL